jgi:mRNA-degrading endonuclease RelE of RelBE toxin-antitoxin system
MERHRNTLVKVEYSEAFKRQLKWLARRYRHIKQDLEPLINALIAGETPGDQLTGQGYTLYKARVQNSDSLRGKSGGYRVIYYLKTTTYCILVTIYSKSDQGDIEPDRLEQLLAEIAKGVA